MMVQPLQSPIASFGAEIHDASDSSEDETSAQAHENPKGMGQFPDSSPTVLGFSDGLISTYYTKSQIGKGKMKATEEDWVENECGDWRISRIGGRPSYPESLSKMRQGPPASMSLCGSCQNPMPLLTQIYCPLDSSPFERILYTFGCPRQKCRKSKDSVRSWRVNIPFVEEEQAPEIQQKENQVTIRDASNVEQMGLARESSSLGSMIFGGSSSVTTANSTTNPFASSMPSTSKANSLASLSTRNPFTDYIEAPKSSSASSTPKATSAGSGMTTTKPIEEVSANMAALTASMASSEIIRDDVDEDYDFSYNEEPTSERVPNEDSSLESDLSGNPYYPPHYLTTAYESEGKSKSSTRQENRVGGAKQLDTLQDDRIEEGSKSREGKGSGGRVKKGARTSGPGSKGKNEGASDGWSKEEYEVQRVRGVDNVLLKFQEVVSQEGEQVVRYNFRSAPIPFSSKSKPYSSLFPNGQFSADRIPICSHCKGPSTFELQLMPNLCNILNRTPLISCEVSNEIGDAGSRGEKGSNIMKEDGLDFATVWIFACMRECGFEEEKGAFGFLKEENVMVEWEEY